MPYPYMRVQASGGGGPPFLHDTVELTNIVAASYAILLSYWLLAINSKLYIICATSTKQRWWGKMTIYYHTLDEINYSSRNCVHIFKVPQTGW